MVWFAKTSCPAERSSAARAAEWEGFEGAA
jgi:hypothetical protein